MSEKATDRQRYHRNRAVTEIAAAGAAASTEARRVHYELSREHEVAAYMSTSIVTGGTVAAGDLGFWLRSAIPTAGADDHDEAAD